MMKKMIMLVMCLAPFSAFGQVTVEWSQQSRGVSIAVDGQHNVFTVDYDYNLAGDILLTKRAPDGTFLWNATYDQTDNSKWEKATWVETDSDGNAIVTGTLMSGYSNPVNAASILMKFSPEGTLLWRRVYETNFDGSYTKKCIVDELDNIYVLGLGLAVTKVKKFSAAGDSIWTYYDQFGVGAPINLKFTADNGLLIVGRGIIGSINGFAKIDRDGNSLWSLTGQNSLTVGDAAGDDFGNTYVVSGEYVANGGTVLKKLNSSGVQVWSHVFGPFSGNRVEVGSDGAPVMSGFPSINSVGAAFMKADSSGQLVWSNLDADGPLGLMLHAMLRLDDQNNAYLGAGTLFDMAICKVNADGSSAWTVTTPGSYAYAFDFDSVHNVYVVGGQTAKIRQTLPAPTLTYVFAEACASYLAWSAVEGAASYSVLERVNTNVEWTLLGVVTETTWPLGCEVSGLKLFQVVAVD
ncbi:MAG: hypothetical protein IPG71_10735 [bacterium]|nr:hypothetical protein [bacterium]